MFRTWDKTKVKEWLESIKCGHYNGLFEQNHITGEILLECDQNSLKEMGIKKVGDRIRVNQSLKALREKTFLERSADQVNSSNGKRLSGSSFNALNAKQNKSLQQLDSEVISPFVNAGSHSASPVEGFFGRARSSSNARHRTSNSQLQQATSISAPATAAIGNTIITSSNVTKVQTVLRKPNENVKNLLSMDIVKQSTIKFIYSQGQSKTVNISGCYTAEQIKLKALKKLSINEITAEGWAVHVADNELGTTTRQLTDDELTTICRSSDRQERKRLILCVKGTNPSLKQMSKSQQIFRDSLSLSGGTDSLNSVNLPLGNVANGQKRHDDEYDDDDDDDDDDDEEAQTVFPDVRRSRHLSKLSGQRPPSELISSNLAHFFPETNTGVLERTVRNSIRFSRRMSRMSRYSHNRQSLVSMVWGIPESDEIPPVPPVPSISDEHDTDTIISAPKLPSPESTIMKTEKSDSKSMLLPKNLLRKSLLSRKHKSQSEVPTQASIGSKASSVRSSVVSEKSDTGTFVLKRGSAIEGSEGLEDEYDDDYDEDEEEDEELEQAILGGPESGPTRWIKGRLIGAGSFGTVYLGMNAFTGELMAVKQVELPSEHNSDDEQKKKSMAQALQREMNILRELRHENIVQYLGSNSEGNYLNIFLEYVPGGSVATLLNVYGVFEESLVRNFVRQILTGLKYLHDQHIVHRDIKGANVLVDNKGCIKISDFGISKKAEAQLLTNNRVSMQGSVYWMAPEVIKQTSYTRKADIWSLGCLIIEMFSGVHPFPELAQMQAIFRLGSKEPAPTMPPDCTGEAKDFLGLTFAIDIDKRPTADELLKHEFLKPMIRP